LDAAVQAVLSESTTEEEPSELLTRIALVPKAGPGSTSWTKTCDAVRLVTESVTVTVTLKDPATVGVPLIVPVELATERPAESPDAAHV
jgi:hypothetical protein